MDAPKFPVGRFDAGNFGTIVLSKNNVWIGYSRNLDTTSMSCSDHLLDAGAAVVLLLLGSRGLALCMECKLWHFMRWV